MATTSKIAPPGLMQTQQFDHLARAMRGVGRAGPLPYDFDKLEDAVDRERVAATCFVVNSVWLAPESERNPNSSKPRFAARAFEIMNPTEDHSKTAEDERYWAIAFVSNYPIGEEEIPRISSALQDYEFDFHVTVGMRSHIHIRAPGVSSFGVGVIVRVEKHDWEKKLEAKRQTALIADSRRRENELLKSAFSDPTSVVCLPASNLEPAHHSTIQRFSVTPAPPTRFTSQRPAISNPNSFKPSSQQRSYHTTIGKRYKSGLLGRMADFVFNIDVNKV